MVPPLKITCAANDAIAKIVKDSQIVILLFHMKERKKERKQFIENEYSKKYV